MKYTVAVLALATAVMATVPNWSPCGNHYGQETCGDQGAGEISSHVVVCTDQHVWGIRQTCGGQGCCAEKQVLRQVRSFTLDRKRN